MKGVSLVLLTALQLSAAGHWGGELRFAIYSDPKTFNPLLVTEQSAGVVRYLTGGMLIRWNHATQAMDPELAQSWRVSPDGREIRFELRPDARFSDGAPVTAQDAAFTFHTLLDPKTPSPDADAFRLGGQQVTVEAPSERVLVLKFAQPIAGVERLFGFIAIVSQRTLQSAADPSRMPTAGPFHVAEYQPGAEISLVRNPYYWKTVDGRRLPYLDGIRLKIRQDRALEVNDLLSGELDLIDSVDPKAFARLANKGSVTAIDAGPSLDSEQLWFNQNPSAPLADYRKAWFHSPEFRRAISLAIHRDDLARLVFDAHAQPAAAIVPASNRAWNNPALKPPPFDPNAAQKLLFSAGFRLDKGELRDTAKHPVQFSIITNAGSSSRERLGVLIQQDLERIGIHVRLITLDFPSLIERITRTFDYEACLLGMVNDDLDPNSQMNVWLSSGPSHLWYPGEKTPATEWEAEIDKLMVQQSRETKTALRKKAFDRVQEIVAEQVPVIFLVGKHSLCAYGPRVGNASASPFFPQTFWNIDQLYIRAGHP
ncbi:MAG TPA: ABC transporter substrate-binding protein [Bryobacteraceae bacterium]|nr:ABC transporter substrate-binding protein [Bryobacteraceae bacterium]